MPTPAVSSVCSATLDVRNWQSKDQIDIVQQATIELENRHVSFRRLVQLIAFFLESQPQLHTQFGGSGTPTSCSRSN
jgi:hypothetical protein